MTPAGEGQLLEAVSIAPEWLRRGGGECMEGTGTTFAPEIPCVIPSWGAETVTDLVDLLD